MYATIIGPSDTAGAMRHTLDAHSFRVREVAVDEVIGATRTHQHTR